MPEIKVSHLTKKFGDVIAVDNVSFESFDGELLTLLGPSGCGKTTTLRCIAGLEKPDDGEIYVGRALITSAKEEIFVPPEKRGLSMVFQSYAIWPHMNVFDNVSYGLKVRKLPRQEIVRRVKEVLDLVDLGGLEKRHPAQLSGGQQQRVALARSLSLEPKLLLLDEPLSNLDAKLRERMRFELRYLQKRLGITTVYVTHDQAEAMVISDRTVVMNKGRIEQLGTPLDIYFNPETKFVADFIGIMNFMTGTVLKKATDGFGVVKTRDGVDICCYVPESVREGDEVLLSIRPEKLEIFKDKPADNVNVWKGKISKRAFLGSFVDYWVVLGEKELRIQSDFESRFESGQDVYVKADPRKCKVIPSR